MFDNLVTGFSGFGGFGGGGGGGRKDPSPSVSSDPGSAQNLIQPEQLGATGDYLDDGSQTSAEKAADDHLGFFNQLFGSLTGENQRILQNLMSEATKAQYDYEERMSNTAYQRAVRDMKLAGLNPAVLFSQGNANAASTPSVGIAQVATENQLLSFFSSAGALLSGLGSVFNSVLGNVLPKKILNNNYSEILKLK